MTKRTFEEILVVTCAAVCLIALSIAELEASNRAAKPVPFTPASPTVTSSGGRSEPTP